MGNLIDSLGGIGCRRKEKYRFYLGKIGPELGKSFETVTKKGLIEFVTKVSAYEQPGPETSTQRRRAADNQ